MIKSMNKERRTAIERIVSRLEELQADLTSVCGEEQDAYDNTPESLQETDRYTESEEAISTMEDADGSIQEAIDFLSDLI